MKENGFDLREITKTGSLSRMSEVDTLKDLVSRAEAAALSFRVSTCAWGRQDLCSGLKDESPEQHSENAPHPPLFTPHCPVMFVGPWKWHVLFSGQ